MEPSHAAAPSPAVAASPALLGVGGVASAAGTPASPCDLIDLASPADADADLLRLGPLPSPGVGYGGLRSSVGIARFSVAAGALPGLTPSPGPAYGTRFGRDSLAPGQVAPSPAGGLMAHMESVILEARRGWSGRGVSHGSRAAMLRRA